VVITMQDVLFRWAAGAEPCLDIPAFEVREGESIFLHGPSGSGKSTLLGLLGGVLVPERGAIRILDAELTHMGSAARDRFRADHVGFVFQQFNLIPYLSVLDNVLLPCRFSARRRKRAEGSGASPLDEARRLLDHLDMHEALRHRPVTQLSVGQQQRAAAARALIGGPEIVIADEPTSSLDAERQEAFLELLLRECEAARTTLLFVSHDLRLARSFSRTAALSSVNRA
jgi:putative ABC transport system ATP-binding protein